MPEGFLLGLQGCRYRQFLLFGGYKGEEVMISRIDHVSIAVKDKEKAERFFREILGAIAGAGMGDPKAGFLWQIFSLGDLSRLEIISPTGEGSFLDGFLKDKEGGVHHITLQTPDLRKAMTHLEEQGIPYFGYNEYPGGIWNEIFIHPRNAFGVLIQIAEFKAADWLSEKVNLPDGKRWQVEKTGTGATLIFSHPGGGRVSLDLDRGEIKKLVASLEHAYA
jgi:methylmalonyl-CoA/ethylmalonyl-CoA epimerase